MGKNRIKQGEMDFSKVFLYCAPSRWRDTRMRGKHRAQCVVCEISQAEKPGMDQGLFHTLTVMASPKV
jgi:hypothetical protein